MKVVRDFPLIMLPESRVWSVGLALTLVIGVGTFVGALVVGPQMRAYDPWEYAVWVGGLLSFIAACAAGIEIRFSRLRHAAHSAASKQLAKVWVFEKGVLAASSLLTTRPTKRPAQPIFKGWLIVSWDLLQIWEYDGAAGRLVASFSGAELADAVRLRAGRGFFVPLVRLSFTDGRVFEGEFVHPNMRFLLGFERRDIDRMGRTLHEYLGSSA